MSGQPPPREGCLDCRLIGERCGRCEAKETAEEAQARLRAAEPLTLRNDALSDEEVRDLVLWETEGEIPAFRVGWCFYRDRGVLPPDRYDPTGGLWGQNERVACGRGALACRAVREVLGPVQALPLVAESRVWTRSLSDSELLHLWNSHGPTASEPCVEERTCPLRDCRVGPAPRGLGEKEEGAAEGS